MSGFVAGLSKGVWDALLETLVHAVLSQVICNVSIAKRL
ncbi:Hypothetical protein NGAL_HAMBI2605_62320 [Neorhizobium galegae bv. orientalis]|nr:Hypothetical protein NGAL_HAMBI2566_59980 [Neorhizobium galegae bv. orientalis]CDZ67949.1 Hypothetical protein NGAL_HAMBI2605_62320 [Neorhizobium galegae bv. orientalis]